MAICTWNGIATVKYKNEQECQRHARVKQKIGRSSDLWGVLPTSKK